MNNSGMNTQPSITKYLNLFSPHSSSSDTNSSKLAKTSKRSLKSHKSPKSFKTTKSVKASSSMLKDWLKINKENCDTPNTKNRKLLATQPFDEEAERKLLNRIEYYQKRIKKYEETKRLVEEIEELDKNQPIYVPTSVSSPEKNPHIDCFDMSEHDVKVAYYKHLELLKNINEETVYSERHEIFKNEKDLNDRGGFNLCSNIAMVAFKKEHVMWLSKKLHKWFGEDVDYQMKVLLPELLLQIFMDKYNMSRKAASDYLSNM